MVVGMLIANPNCTTAIAAMVLWPLHKAFCIRRMIMSTYQAASGAGDAGLEELEAQLRDYGNKPIQRAAFPHQLLGNVIPRIDSVQSNGYTKEEMKVAWETRKIFNQPDILISCTAVRVATMRAHAEAITLEFDRVVDVDTVSEVLKAAAMVVVEDDPQNDVYPTPLSCTGKWEVSVGRIRESLAFPPGKGIDLFVCGDQLLRGAALNAIRNLADLSMVIDRPKKERTAPRVALDFVHTNGSKYHVGPMNPTASTRRGQQVPRNLDDDLRGMCWGLRQSDFQSPRESVYSQMKRISDVFQSDLSRCRVGNTIIRPAEDGSINLGFFTTIGRPKVYDNTDYLFVTMEPSQVGSSSSSATRYCSTNSERHNRPDREGPLPSVGAVGEEVGTSPVAERTRVDPQPSTIGKRGVDAEAVMEVPPKAARVGWWQRESWDRSAAPQAVPTEGSRAGGYPSKYGKIYHVEPRV
ncbi:hypothetical protein FOL46_007567 [Perkinsus olseni]|uniref:Semialdehyde dehydrogenase dimerisation domain-containing protein n=1 Tax=Perkinsus olseni TaxID=32597 RepID=A0A7J6MNX2_PEROL|nr:hypothetical protein FOL46_007567 [Perkinsus olseni]